MTYAPHVVAFTQRFNHVSINIKNLFLYYILYIFLHIYCTPSQIFIMYYIYFIACSCISIASFCYIDFVCEGFQANGDLSNSTNSAAQQHSLLIILGFADQFNSLKRNAELKKILKFCFQSYCIFLIHFLINPNFAYFYGLDVCFVVD